jgi:hypothetical protein
MSYFGEIDAWLEGLMEGLPTEQIEAAKKEIKAELLKSYRNGQAAGPRKVNTERGRRRPERGSNR